VSELVFQILDAARDRAVVPFGSAFPSPALFPWSRLARYLGSGARHMDPWSTVESLPKEAKPPVGYTGPIALRTTWS